MPPGKRPWYRGLAPDLLLAVVRVFPHLLADLISRFEQLVGLTSQLIALVRQLEAKLRGAQDTIRELRYRLGLDSTNSSRPPSTDPPGASKRAARRRRSKRRPGGQFGHPAHRRQLLPPDAVDHVVELAPATCHNCGARLDKDGSPRVEPVEPWQTIDWQGPRQGVRVTEYRRLRLTCPACGVVTGVDLPAEARHTAAPGLEALIVFLMVTLRLPRRPVQMLLREILGIRLALGTIQNTCMRASLALEAPYRAIADHVRRASRAYIDETGWRQSGKRRCLWIACTATATLFRVATSKAAKVVNEILGKSRRRIVHCDGYAGFNGLARRQRCWSHLKRNFQALVDRGGPAARVGTALLRLRKELFRWWHRFCRGEISRGHLLAATEPLKERFRQQLLAARDSPDRKAMALGKRLLRYWQDLWWFLSEEGVEPTNNLAEREGRPAVILRKISQQTRSEAGSRFLERALSVARTLQRQGRAVLAGLTRALAHHRAGLPVPDLVFEQETHAIAAEDSERAAELSSAQAPECEQAPAAPPPSPPARRAPQGARRCPHPRPSPAGGQDPTPALPREHDPEARQAVNP